MHPSVPRHTDGADHQDQPGQPSTGHLGTLNDDRPPCDRRSQRRSTTPDIDLLRDKEVLEKLVGTMGGNFQDIRARWEVLNSAVSDANKDLRASDVRDEIVRYIDDEAGEKLTRSDLKKLTAFLKPEDGWRNLKRSGTSAVPQGDATAAYREIDAFLQNIGILVVPVGELERFEPDIPDHGPKWVTQVFERHRHKTPSASSVAFTRSIRDAAVRLSARV